VNGGLAGLLWSYIWTFFGFIFIVLSLAEMASMAPTSGGQYHWVSEFAPRGFQRFLSYMSGWMATLSWQAGSAGTAFFVGILIQGICSQYNLNYVPKAWQGTLFVFAIALVDGIVNIFLVSLLPLLQNIMIIPHGVGWIAVIGFLGALGPKASARDVFLTFTSNGGWDNMGISVLIGQVTAVYMLILSDSAAHLAEEVKTASRAVPLAMIWSFFLNGTVGLAVLITFLFCIPSIEDVLDLTKNPSGSPLLYVFQNASYWGCMPLLIMILMIMVTGTIDVNASTSRQTFAFARDRGLPFGHFFGRVSRVNIDLNISIFILY
jgi:choline transport protein